MNDALKKRIERLEFERQALNQGGAEVKIYQPPLDKNPEYNPGSSPAGGPGEGPLTIWIPDNGRPRLETKEQK